MDAAMRALPRRHLSYASLAILLAVDLLALSALVLDQWLAIGRGWVWLLAAVLTLVMLPAVLRLVDQVFVAARTMANARIPGGTFP